MDHSSAVSKRLDVITGICPHDCPDTCAFQVTVDRETGRAMDLWGHPDHPITNGTLCTKVDHYLERTYHADRVLQPLRRVGRKGEGRFESVSWDTAIGEISGRLRALLDEHGGETVLQYSYAGTMGLLQGEAMAQRFFHALAASRLARTICSEAGSVGYRYTIGGGVGMDIVDYAHANVILLWGTNTLTSNLHLWPFVQQARKRGARVIVIDPVRTRTARAADQWIAIRPGTDAALALALMHVIVRDDLVDHDYVKAYTLGFEALCERVGAWTPDRAQSITGIASQRIEALAREYATTRPAAIRINYGLQRHRGGGMAVRSIACLPALVGAWCEPGGGIALSSSGTFAFDKRGLERPDLLGNRCPRTFNMNRLGGALSLDASERALALHRPRPVDPVLGPESAGPPVKALIVYNCNPAAVAPDQRAVLAGLAREDLFTVVLEQFPTDTVDWADYVLPATTQLEHLDLHKAYGHLYVGLNRPAIAPIGHSLPNTDIFRRLARACGLSDPCFAESDEDMIRAFLAAQTQSVMRDITWERLSSEGYCRLSVDAPYLPFARGNFPTPTGKCEFWSETMAADGYDPLPEYIAPNCETIRSDLHDSGELVCISPPAHSFLNSTFVNVGKFARREGEPAAFLHPCDAAFAEVSDGADVELYNGRGTLQLRAHVTEDVMPGTVVVPSIWWNKLAKDRRNVNWLIDPDETDMGGGALFYDVRVRVRVLARRTSDCFTS